MRNSVEEATKIKVSRDIAIALDGSWQKRRYQSLNSIVAAMNVDTVKVDFEAFSEYCRGKTAFNSAREPSCIANIVNQRETWK
ncbi:hypothetical protein TNIN_160111 [Trichonephila inaurata madagascariensis]|uniref:Uncharacterized protein n=1 Tax=Trichonephila inaurata madagascariensis TaxID=2747483 RepID=A0A8X6MAD5_9ARAC|nr:hypothetical protein TNIN_160111 [Trichonephila inaurata madagascariensis]